MKGIQFCRPSSSNFHAIFFSTFTLIHINFDIKFKQVELEKPAWRHLTALSKLFLMVTDVNMIL